MVLCLGEPPGGFCVVVVFLARGFSFIFDLRFVVTLHSFLFFICCCCFSFIAFWCHPSPFRGLSPGFYAHFILSAQPIAEWFVTLSFSTFPRSSFTVLPQVLQFWVGIFLPTGIFYLMLLHQHFWLNLCLSRPPWEPVVLPWSLQGFILILERQTWSIRLFDSQ